jgi:BirA family biotin operon repressor/biotin-[acetyl-CoA-carboxylase] ligase
MIGQKIISLSVVDSTNNYTAKLHSAHEIDHGAVILAENQSNGRGQRGTEWQSEPGKNLTFSFLLTEINLSVMDQFRLNQLTSLALVKALSDKGLEAMIKWPNDIYIGCSKVAGMLIENSIGSAGLKSSIIGIGLNVNQESFGDLHATSLKMETSKDHNIHETLFSFIYHFNELFELLDEPEILTKKYLEKLMGVNEPISFAYNDHEYNGRVKGIDEIGRIELTADGKKHGPFSLKEVSFII